MVNPTSNQVEYEFDWQNPAYVKQQYQIGRVLSRTFMGVLKQWKPILLAFICFIICVVIISGFAVLFFGELSADVFDSNTSQVSSTIGYILISIFYLLIFLGGIFVMIVTDAAVFSEYRNQQASIRYLLTKASKKIIPLSLGLFFFVFASYIGLLFFIVPALFIYYGWGIFGPIYVNENIGLVDSFGRSWNLMKGYKRWFLLTSIIYSFIVNIGIYVLALVITILAAFVIGGTGGSEVVALIFGILFLVLISILILFGFAFQAAFVTANYLEVCELKEPFDEGSMAAVFS